MAPSNDASPTTMEIKMRAKLRAPRYRELNDGKPIEAGTIIRLPTKEAMSLIARRQAVAYDDKQKALDKAAEEKAKAAKEAEEAEKKADAQARAAAAQEKESRERARGRSGTAPLKQ